MSHKNRKPSATTRSTAPAQVQVQGQTQAKVQDQATLNTSADATIAAPADRAAQAGHAVSNTLDDTSKSAQETPTTAQDAAKQSNKAAKDIPHANPDDQGVARAPHDAHDTHDQAQDEDDKRDSDATNALGANSKISLAKDEQLEQNLAQARAKAAARARERALAASATQIDPAQMEKKHATSGLSTKAPAQAQPAHEASQAHPAKDDEIKSQAKLQGKSQGQDKVLAQDKAKSLEQDKSQDKSKSQDKVKDKSLDEAQDKAKPQDKTKAQDKSDDGGESAASGSGHKNLQAFLAGLTLAVFAALCVICIITVEHKTEDKIQAYRDAQEQKLLTTMLPEASAQAQGKLSFQCKLISDPRIGKNMQTYIVHDESGKTLGLIANYSTSRGYSNPLILIAGIDLEGHIRRIEVKLSRETPGIGDKVEHRKGNYLDQFVGKGLDNANWEVKKFNGQFDYITGATVTSRAVVLATKDLLQVLKDTTHPDLLPDCR